MRASERVLANPPASEHVYKTYQFSQAVRVGDIVWVSGQVGVHSRSLKLAEGIEAQSRLAFEHLKNVLNEAGASLADVVELVTYHLDFAELDSFMKVKAEFFPENFPAWTAVGVTALALPGIRVEIRATAVVGSALKK